MLQGEWMVPRGMVTHSHQLGGMFPPTCAAAWRAAMQTHSSALRIIAMEQSCVGAAVPARYAALPRLGLAVPQQLVDVSLSRPSES